MTTKINKYDLYENSVQDAHEDARYFSRLAKKVLGREAFSLREDFCGTFWLGYEWASLSSKHSALGIDLDPAPLAWGVGRRNDPAIRARMKSRIQDVRAKVPGRYDLAVALNFSYFVFKARIDMLAYFKSVQKSLVDDGAFILSHFGGPDVYSPSTMKTACRIPKGERFTYIWEEKKFNAINNHALYSIHYELKNGKKYQNAFHYDWRIWTLPELKDLLEEAGFDSVDIFVEDDDGNYRVLTQGIEDDILWIAYVVAKKKKIRSRKVR